jgi:hypothetical protein
MKFKMANAKDEDFPALSERQIEKLRKELRERLSHEEVKRSLRLEALGRIFTASMVDEQSFHQFWVIAARSRHEWHGSYIHHPQRQCSNRWLEFQADPVLVLLCQNCAKTPSVRTMGVSFERKAGSPNCWKV